MFKRRTYKFMPESYEDMRIVAGWDIGQVFTREEDNKRYQLIYRDAFKLVIRRWTLFDDVLKVIKEKVWQRRKGQE